MPNDVVSLSAPAEWQPDEEVLNCNDCQRKFTWIRRRHHCRMCGLIFCHSCSSHVTLLPMYGLKDPQRTCNLCKEKLEQASKSALMWDKVEEWDILKFIGEGAFGKVYKVKNKESGQVLAMKVIDKKKLRSNQAKRSVRDEKTFLQNWSHPFIVKLHKSFQTHDKLFIVMDYLGGGDCYYLMTKALFPEPVVRIYTCQIALALNYIHQHNMIYRDLKPENCVLDFDGNIVLTDFGMVGKLDDHGTQYDQLGTPDYWAPEIHKGHRYGKAIDFWALGCLIYEFITGQHPFLDKYGRVPRHKILKDEPRLDRKHVIVSANCIDLVTKFLHKSPDERLQNIKKIQAHSWFEGIDWDAIYRKEVPIPGGWVDQFLKDKEGFDPAYTEKPAVISPSGHTREVYAGFSWSANHK